MVTLVDVDKRKERFMTPELWVALMVGFTVFFLIRDRVKR